VNVFCAAFIYLQLGFVIFWQKNISAKANSKMLVKLAAGLNFNLMTTLPKKLRPSDRWKYIFHDCFTVQLSFLKGQ